MKKIVITAVVLVLVLVAAPWAVGMLAEKRINSGLDEVVKTAPYLSIVDRKFTRGWFTSEQEVTFEVLGPWLRGFDPQAVLDDAQPEGGDADADAGAEIEAAPSAGSAPDPANTDIAASSPEARADQEALPPPPPPPKPIAPIKFTVRNHVVHGPVLWFTALGIARVDSTVVIPAEIRDKLVEVFGEKPLVRVSTRVRFFGGGTTTVSGDERDVTIDGKNQSLSYDSFWFKIGYSAHLDDFDIDGDWPRFEFKGPAAPGAAPSSFKFEGMTVRGSSKRVRGDLYDGDFKVLFANSEFIGGDKQFTSIKGLHYGVSSTIDDDFMDVAFRFGSGEVKAKAFDELGLKITETHYDMTVRRLHLDTLEKMVGEIKASYSRPAASIADFDRAVMQPFKEYGVELLKHDPELVIDRIGMSTADGDLYLKGVIRLKGVTEQDLAASALGLIGKLEADISFEMAQKLGPKLPNGASAVATAIDQGYARLEGKNVVSRLEFKNGVLKINGKEQGIPPLGGAPQPPPVQE